MYFTDLGPRPAPPGELSPAVYYVPPGGVPIRVADDISRPNGVQLSRDEKTLYVNDTGGIHAFAFDVLPDGRLSNRRVFATYVGRDQSVARTEEPVSNADGLVIDEEGRLYALTEAGIEVVSSSGQHLGVIPIWCMMISRQRMTTLEWTGAFPPVTDEYDAVRGAKMAGLHPAMDARAPLTERTVIAPAAPAALVGQSRCGCPRDR